MTVKYSHNTHFEVLKSWYDDRNTLGLKPEMLPDLGYVSNDIAIAFLVTTNSPVAWIANWTVDPKATLEQRNRAIYELLVQCEEEAKRLGYKILQSCAMKDNMKLRFDVAGYKSFGDFTFVAKSLETVCH